jgi:spermidine/putrescine transport system substrate-binding protein
MPDKREKTMNGTLRRQCEPISRRALLAGLVAVTGASTLPRSSRAAGELNILVWCDHADAKLIQPFEQAHGVKVNVKTYEGTGTGLSIIEQSQPGEWDIFMVDATDVPRIVEKGIFMELPETAVPWDDMFDPMRHSPFARINGKLYAVPEKFGYYGVCFNKNKVDAADARRNDIMWNEKYKGRIAVYDYYFPLIQMIALANGWKPAEIDAEKLAEIRKRLLAAKPNIKLIGDIVSVQSALVTGDVDLIFGGAEFTVSNLIPANPQLDWVIADSGGLIWTQGLTILNASSRKDLALEFVKWVMSSKGQGLLATSDCYWGMPTNSKAALDETQKKILRWDEQPAYLKESVFSQLPASDIDTRMLDVWTEFLQS